MIMSVGDMLSNTSFEFYLENYENKQILSQVVAYFNYFNLSDLSRGTTGTRLNDRLTKYNTIEYGSQCHLKCLKRVSGNVMKRESLLSLFLLSP